MSSFQATNEVIKPGGNVLNIEKGSSSIFVSKGKKVKQKASIGGPSIGSIPKIAKSKGKGK